MSKKIELINELIKKYMIPARPDIMDSIQAEFQKSDPNFEFVLKLISSDIHLSAVFLKMANIQLLAINEHAPAFKSIYEAVLLIGKLNIPMVIQTVRAQAGMQENKGLRFDRFWDNSSDVAILSSYLAQRLAIVDSNKAYMLGLFIDCGMAIMAQAEPTFYRVINQGAQAGLKITEVQDNAFGINHQIISYRLCLDFKLPEEVCRAVLTQDELESPRANDTELDIQRKALISVVKVATMISERFRSIMRGNVFIKTWDDIQQSILDNLELNQQDARDLMEDTLEKVEWLLEKHQK